MLTRVMVSVFEFMMSVLMLGFGIYLTYRMIITANPDFDMEIEIKNGNVGVSVLVAAAMWSTAMIVHKVLFSVVSMFRMFVTAYNSGTASYWHLPFVAVAHLVMAFALAIMTISITLRMFGKLTTRMKEGEELKKGNTAVGVLLAAVVVVAAMYVSEGVSSLSKALTPQVTTGKIQILR